MQNILTNKLLQTCINFDKILLHFIYFKDNRIYLINNITAMRQSLLHSKEKSDTVSSISKKADQNESERD